MPERACTPVVARSCVRAHAHRHTCVCVCVCARARRAFYRSAGMLLHALSLFSEAVESRWRIRAAATNSEKSGEGTTHARARKVIVPRALCGRRHPTAFIPPRADKI